MRVETFEEQNGVLFKSALNALFQAMSTDNPSKEESEIPLLDLFITPTCNQQCTYCYVQKHKQFLYPDEINNKEVILHNLRLFLDYCLEKGYTFKRIDLFSGEIYGYPFGNAVFDIFLEYIKKGVKIEFISVPTNASFCFSQELISIMNKYIFQFEILHCRLSLSISFDGPEIDKLSRPLLQNGVTKNNDYLTNLIQFMKLNRFGFHPMIDPATIELQKSNYDSWLKLLEENFLDEEMIGTYGQVMMLETRENTWTEDKIITFLEWVKYIAHKDIEVFFKGNVENFFRINAYLENLIDVFPEYFGPRQITWTGYTPYRLGPAGNSFGCVFGKSICIRMGDLAIGSCHRVMYPKFQLGKFIIDKDQDKITDIECYNYPLTSATLITGVKTKPFCATCPIKDVCIKPCIGANYENSQELFYPVPENCTLQKAKTVFLYYLYKSLGCEQHPYIDPAYEALKEFEPEVEQKWKSISQSIIYNN